MEIVCTKCGSKACVKNGRLHNSQRYKCKSCGYQFTKLTPRGKPKQDKILALVLYLSGLSMRMTAKIVGVSTQTIVRWLKNWNENHVKDFVEDQEKKTYDEIEIDEMQPFISKKTSQYGHGKLWIIPLEHSSDGFAGIVVQRRSKN